MQETSTKSVQEFKELTHEERKCEIIKQYNFSQRSVDTWNGSREEVIKAKRARQTIESWTVIAAETGPHECILGHLWYS